MNHWIRTVFVFITLAVSLSSYANPEFWALVKKAAPTPPASLEWREVEDALAKNPFIDIDWNREGGISGRALIANHNPEVLRQLQATQEAYDALWRLVRDAALNQNPKPDWQEVEKILLADPKSKLIDCKKKGRATVRTILLLYNFPLYERVFGKCQQAFPKLWRLLVNTIVKNDATSWREAQAQIMKNHAVLDWRVDQGESLREIVRDFKPEFYERSLAPLENYEWLNVLGSGFFGDVRKARHRVTGKVVAMKQLTKAQYCDCDLPYPPREVALMKAIRPHAHVIRLLEMIETEDAVFLMTEVASGGELFAYWSQADRLTEKKSRFFMRQILSGVDFLHRNGICHRDLKLENILLDAKGNIKIADLGLGAFFGQNPLNTFCGSPDYASPEVWIGRKYDGPSADVWSMGVMLFILVTGYLPFNNPSDTMNIRYLWPKSIFVSAGIKLLVQGIFQFVGQRFTVEQMINNLWMNDDGRLKPIRRQPIDFEGEPETEGGEEPVKVVAEPAEELAEDAAQDEDVQQRKFKERSGSCALM